MGNSKIKDLSSSRFLHASARVILVQKFQYAASQIVKIFTSRRSRVAHRMLSILNKGYGHWQTVERNNVININGEPIPWYTYPAIEYIDSLDFGDKAVFEWGAGNSSLYWARVAKTVTSIEHDPFWHQKLVNKSPVNLNIMLIENEDEYINAISLTNRKWDVIIIDGVYRYKCALIAPRFLEEGGLIILDNSDWLPKSAEVLREANLLQVDMSGFGPIATYTFTTSVFFHRNNRTKSKDGRQPRPSICAIPVPNHSLDLEPR